MEEGRKLIVKACWAIRKESIVKMWIQVIKKAKEYTQENSTNFEQLIIDFKYDDLHDSTLEIFIIEI